MSPTTRGSPEISDRIAIMNKGDLQRSVRLKKYTNSQPITLWQTLWRPTSSQEVTGDGMFVVPSAQVKVPLVYCRPMVLSLQVKPR